VDNIKTDLREIGWDVIDWIDLAQERDSGWLLWTRLWTFGFHKTLGSSWVAAQLAASQEGLSFTSEWVSWFTAAEICLPRRCVATSDARTTENTALLLLRAFASAVICLASWCLAINYSGFQASCHDTLYHSRSLLNSLHFILST
jgi:hypothetical protein